MSRQKPPLVYQHLERIPVRVLVKYKTQLVRHIKGKNGIYALYKGKKLYYVGLAKNLRSRLNAHQRNKHSGLWDHCSVYLTAGDHYLREIEALAMRIGGPQGNTQRGKLSRSQDLMKIFLRELTDSFRDEVKELKGQRTARRPVRKAWLTEAGRKGELGRYTDSSFRIKGRAKGKMVYAMVRKDGTVRFKGKVYTSPSGAGKAAIGRSCNGWTFWSFQKGRGYWVPLQTLRE